MCFHPKEEPKAHSLAPHINQKRCGSFKMGLEQIDRHDHIITTHDFYQKNWSKRPNCDIYQFY